MIQLVLWIGWSIAGLYFIYQCLGFLMRMRKKTLISSLSAIGIVGITSGATVVYAQPHVPEAEQLNIVEITSTSTHSSDIPVASDTWKQANNEMRSQSVEEQQIKDEANIQNHEMTQVNSQRETYVVVKGDNFWTIAEKYIRDDEDLTRLWVRIVEENRLSLRSGNPNIIYPGEEIIISHS